MNPSVRPLRAIALLATLALAAACGGAGGDDGDGVRDTAAAEDTRRDGGGLFDVPAADVGRADVRVDTKPVGPDVAGVPVCEEAGGFGCPCDGNDDCTSGYCIPWDEGYVCSRNCVDSCPPGWDCRAVANTFPDVLFVCWPGQSRLCQPCGADDQCGRGVCLTLADGARCTRPCSERSPCPGGYDCEVVTSEADPTLTSEQCVPTSGACDCGPWLAEDDLVRPCNRANDAGNCWGDQRCDLAAGWSDCSAPEPAPESCNGRDDDCNGFVDERAPTPEEACEESGPAGTCTGDWICLGEAGWSCTAATPAAESCNYRDDDCDGETDEDFRDPATGAYTSVAHCGVCGNDCGGVFPNATAACGEGATGEPSCVVAACDPGHYLVGSATCLPVRDPSCEPCSQDANCAVPGNLCLDLDGGRFCGRDASEGNLYGTPAGTCPDGFAAESFADGAVQCVPATGSCTCYRAEDAAASRPCVRTNEAGTCTGFERCDPETGWSDCDVAAPAPESCNGADDDCDGRVDEEVPPPPSPCIRENEFGLCGADWRCEGEAGWVCPAADPAAETCDGADDDCDGATDEDFRDEDGRYVAYDHCGLCGSSCEGAVLFATGTTCDASGPTPVCVPTGCLEDYYVPPENPRVCIPVFAEDCAPCTEDAHCEALPGGLCEALDGARICTRQCAAADDCLPGYDCTASGRCLPRSRSCACLIEDAGAERACFRANESGTCAGAQTCAPETGWTPCTAGTPAPEACNGADDDCDGFVDEAVAHDPPDCEVANEHGRCLGVWRCAGEEAWQCTAATPAAEACNGADDDCDGAVDEDFRADDDGPYVADEHCGACGVACEGTVANGTAACVLVEGRARCEVESCAPGFYPAGPFTCAPATDDRCAPCLGDDDCPTPGDRCLDLDGGRFCGRDCGADNLHGSDAGACPDGFVCEDFDGARQCVPPSGSCSCLADDAGETRPCVVRNDHGACFGEQTCAPAEGWSACTAATPAAETCNGVDDDCDAIVDDVPGRGEPCVLENEYGTCDGVRDCAVEAEALVCAGPSPGPETCNARDDDCDGAVDEDFPTRFETCAVGDGVCRRTGFLDCTEDGAGVACNATPGEAADEICDGLDNDCDGQTDEEARWANRGQVCSRGTGVCQAWGVWTCDPADPLAATVCDADPPTGGDEVCDGLDNDCDGQTDEELAAPPCEEQRGVCAGATKACGGGLGWLACTVDRYPASYEFRETTCDDLDNDCDGETDTVDVDGDGHVDEACGGDDCDDLNPFAFPGAPEVCGDGVDNDCNGTPEDRDVDEDGFLAAPCGGADCNDGSADAHPGLDEVCGDRLDNDCDGSIDNKDIDGDSFLDPACGGIDCDDTRDFVHPGAPERCDDLDDDCNGVTDDKDADGDGHIDDDPLCGGDDCDDGDVFVSPTRSEVCGNEIDEDCSGRLDDRDVDADGFLDGVGDCAGDDCDDFDPLVYPGAPEIYDAKDSDCDGLVDEGGLIPVGAVIVSEVMQNPANTSDSSGEWFEVYNAWTFPVNLHSWVILDADGPDRFQVGAPEGIVVPAGGTAVFCRNPNPDLNGGVVCDYGYDDFILSNADDEIILTLDGVTIDTLAWDGGPTFPDPSGTTMSLDPNAFDAAANDIGGNWCLASLDDRLPSGDRGSPGRINPTCTGAPVVTAVEPRDGVDDGGETIRILGSGFTGATGALVGGVACESWLVVNDNTMRCVTPAHAAGDVDVTVEKGAESATLADGYRFTGEAVTILDWADIQWPATLTAEPGFPTALIYCQCHAPGVTEPDGAPAGIQAQVGWGPALSDPRDEPGWTWTDAVWNRQYFANDEFMQTLTVAAEGTYSYACRFSDDGGVHFMYGDFDPGTADGFSVSDLGVLTVD